MRTYVIRMAIILVSFLVIVFSIFLYVQKKLNNMTEDTVRYDKHFVFISKSADSYTMSNIYDEASDYGKRNNVYIENLVVGQNASFSEADYVNMAAAMRVDGIIVEASDDDALRDSINTAGEEGIPTITLLSDCPDSSRKSYLELGNYNLGRDFGRVIISIAKNRTPKLAIILDEAYRDANSDIITGLNETLKYEGNHLSPEIEYYPVDNNYNFRVTDKAREILTSKDDHPDIIICTSAGDTQLVYQAIKDYNLGKGTDIIGTGLSYTMLNAIKDGDIAAIVDADSTQVGMQCVEILGNYISSGNVSENVIVEDTVVTGDNVERYLADE